MSLAASSQVHSMRTKCLHFMRLPKEFTSGFVATGHTWPKFTWEAPFTVPGPEEWVGLVSPCSIHCWMNKAIMVSSALNMTTLNPSHTKKTEESVFSTETWGLQGRLHR